MIYGVWASFAAATGLVAGSFANVAIARWAEDRSVVAPRSHCPSCGVTLGPTELIPVVSYLAQRGRCRACGASIGVTHPLIEALGGLLSLLLFWRLVPTGAAPDPVHLGAWAMALVAATLLVIAAYVDVRHHIIPDECSIYAVPLGLASATASWLAGYDGWLALDPRDSVFGALAGASLLATTSLVFRAVRGRDGLGWGDVKLAAMIGSFVGPIPVVFVVLFLGSLIGSVVGLTHLAVRRERVQLPFGPSLALAAVVHLLYGDVVARALMPGMASLMGWS